MCERKVAMSERSRDNKAITEVRREQRKEAFILLFEQVFQKESIENIIEDAKAARDLELGKYTRRLALGVEEKMDELDAVIEANLTGWKMNRVSKVSLTIMRMAVYEMLYVDNVPVSVSINEAVELAKKYATPGDGSFVNGVLGSVAKKLDKTGEE